MVCLLSLPHNPSSDGRQVADILNADEVITEIINGDDDDFLGLDHVDRSRTMRNGVGDLFLK